MKISIIVTTYNRPEALAAVLEGLRRQTEPPGEVIVADDGSGPETAGTVREAAGRMPWPLSHVWQEDRGFRASAIRNRAILACTGSYIVLLDGDCIPDRHFVGDHRALAQPGFFFQGRRVLVGKGMAGRFTASQANAGRLRLFFAREIENAHHLIRLPWFPALTTTRMGGIRSCNMGFFRGDIFAVNGFNADFTGWGREDSELALRFYRLGLKRKDHPFRAVCFHLWHPENPREGLERNETLLRDAMASEDYECKNGLVQK
ncbi:glycosyltransferase family 2 protein [Desulfococcus sp.]|uniref:glycosyltransferase family 2 protein n=1 Tax=Desulfococcus sp. TaxID=2025834 RepID=UPI003593DD97